MILPVDAPIGVPIADYLNLADTVLDLEITPNRTDCMSMIGIAREVAAVYAEEYRLPSVSELIGLGENSGAVATPATFAPEAQPPIIVNIADPNRSARYTAQLIKGAKVQPSPDWLVERIVAAGARPINNIVDITNYIMFEVGQPLHAFDYDTLAKDADGNVSITVRAANPGEVFQTLDEVERRLDTDVTCIVDANAPSNNGQGQTIALAGVMGGLASEVTESTVNILLESATFSTAHTSRTSRRLKLVSESSMRFERGVDDATCAEFSARAAELIVAIAGGELVGGIVESYPAPRELPTIAFRVDKFAEFVGSVISVDEIMDILTRLGCIVDVAPSLTTPLLLSVTAPTFRPDLLREVDLYEEVLRVYGMNNIQPTLPAGSGRIGLLTDEQSKERKINMLLRAMGLNEAMTYAFVPPTDTDDLQMPFAANEEAVELINPMSSEMSVMRRSIIPGLLRAVAYNINHGTPDVQLYETGNVFFITEGQKLPREKQLLSAVMVGESGAPTWNQRRRPVDFFDAKGVIETIGNEMNLNRLRFKELAADDASWLQAGRAASVLAGSSQLGWIGEIHPRVAAAFDVDVAVIAFELDLQLLTKASKGARDFTGLSQYPAVSRDIALVVDNSVNSEQVSQVLHSAGGNLLAEARLFDVFSDAARLGADKKSLAFALSYRADDRTLTSEEVDTLHQKVIDKASKALGAKQRT